MLKTCARGHYEVAYNSIDPFHMPVECPACDALRKWCVAKDDLSDLQEELTKLKAAQADAHGERPETAA